MTTKSTERTPAEEIGEVVALLREPLPAHLRSEPFIVHTDSESPDGIAFCKDHPNDDEFWLFTSCEDCEVIETHSVQLAELLAGFLLARESLADLLDDIAGVVARQGGAA